MKDKKESNKKDNVLRVPVKLDATKAFKRLDELSDGLEEINQKLEKANALMDTLAAKFRSNSDQF